MKNLLRWSVIFLIDKIPPTKIALLKRSPNKKYAPGYFTGLGGKIGDIKGHESESPLDGAYRELLEETQESLDVKNSPLKEFARCIYKESGATLYYFWCLCERKELPSVNPKDGKLVWASKKKLLDKKIIPTTIAVCQEWSKRNFMTNNPFTIHVEQVGKKESVELIEVQEIEDGLKF